MSAKKSDNANVTRITATSSGKKTKGTSKPSSKAEQKAPKISVRRSLPRFLAPVGAMGRYFKGAWTELKQVRWPTRGATWSLTGAVLAFTTFFVVLILLLDAGFKLLFEKLLG